MMQEAVVKKIRNRISRSKFGEVFFVSSFSQYDTEYCHKVIGGIRERRSYFSNIKRRVCQGSQDSFWCALPFCL